MNSSYSNLHDSEDVLPVDVDEKKIIVVGAGLVGAVQALLFARSGFSVTVVERQPLLTDSGNSSRTVALSHRSWQLLHSAGLWPDIDNCPIKSVQVTEQGNFGAVKLDARKFDVEALGYVISNHGFEHFLHDQLRHEPNVEVLESATVVSVSNDEQSALVMVEQSGVTTGLSASLVIAADGTKSVIREMLGVKTKHRDYQQCALLANVRASRGATSTAFERFTADGPLALLPTGATEQAGCWYSMVYTAPEAQAGMLASLTDEDFLALLQKKFGGKLGRFNRLGKRHQMPLSLIESEEQSTGRFVLIGNAVRTLHPVAGQGMNLALRDVFELVSQIRNAQTTAKALAEFEKKRRHDQWLITRQTDLLARVFTGKPWPLRMPVSLMTGSALLLLDLLEPLKKAFAKTNMGRHVPLPEAGRAQAGSASE